MADPHNVVLKVMSSTGTVTKSYVFEAVNNVEPTDSVEISKEPGVMGRIGPMFPRTVSFKIRVRDGDPRTPDYPTARAQHNLLRSLMGCLIFIDARSAPPETIYWTLENVKGMDSNEAANAWDVDVTAAEILGGEFGEFIDPNELTTETGLVPVVAVSPEVLGIGDQTIFLTLDQAAINGSTDPGSYQSGAGLLLRDNDAAIRDLFPPATASNANGIAVQNVSAGRPTAQVLSPGRYQDGIPLPFLDPDTHVLVYGARLPAVPGCTLSNIKFSVLGTNFSLTVDTTRKLQFIALNIGSTAYIMGPNSGYVIKRAVQDPSTSKASRRSDVNYPADMDLFIVLAPDKFNLPFTSENFSRYSILLFFAGRLAA